MMGEIMQPELWQFPSKLGSALYCIIGPKTMWAYFWEKFEPEKKLQKKGFFLRSGN